MLTLVDEIARHGTVNPNRAFGGLAILMLRYGHRLLKDIDIFVPGPQALRQVNPRLPDFATNITDDYGVRNGSS